MNLEERLINLEHRVRMLEATVALTSLETRIWENETHMKDLKIAAGDYEINYMVKSDPKRANYGVSIDKYYLPIDFKEKSKRATVNLNVNNYIMVSGATVRLPGGYGEFELYINTSWGTAKRTFFIPESGVVSSLFHRPIFLTPKHIMVVERKGGLGDVWLLLVGARIFYEKEDEIVERGRTKKEED